MALKHGKSSGARNSRYGPTVTNHVSCCRHWIKIVILTKFSSSAALKVVILTNVSAAMVMKILSRWWKYFSGCASQDNDPDSPGMWPKWGPIGSCWPQVRPVLAPCWPHELNYQGSRCEMRICAVIVLLSHEANLGFIKDSSSGKYALYKCMCETINVPRLGFSRGGELVNL